MIKPPLGTILVCLHVGHSAISKLIQWQTRGEYSHASLILPDGRHIESREFRGVVVHPEFVPVDGEAVDFFTVPITPAQADAITDFALQEDGAPYDYVMVWHFVTRGGPVRESKEHWFCSEFVFAALVRANIALLRATQAWEVSPGLLARSPWLSPAEGVLAA